MRFRTVMPALGWLIAAALYAALLLPALLAPIPGLHAHPRLYLREFHGSPASMLARDVLLNLIVFIPLGWLLARAARRTSATAPAAVLIAGSLAAAFSLGVETIQYFIATRYSSILDVLANTVGATLGALLVAAPPGRRS
jgi:VanZ family protein